MKKKIECHNCGHFSMVKTDNGWIKGCSALSEVMREEAMDGNIQVADADGKVEILGQIEYIDTAFLLNRTGDCIAFVPQNDKQKVQLETIRQFRRKNLFKHWLWKILNAIGIK